MFGRNVSARLSCAWSLHARKCWTVSFVGLLRAIWRSIVLLLVILDAKPASHQLSMLADDDSQPRLSPGVTSLRKR